MVVFTRIFHKTSLLTVVVFTRIFHDASLFPVSAFNSFHIFVPQQLMKMPKP
jgi:hypothetical protein